MRPPDEQNAAREAEILAAERAIAQRRWQDARNHLKAAAELGAERHDLQVHLTALEQGERQTQQRGRRTGWIGFWLGGLCYLLLSTRQPPQWTVPVWATLAFLLVPLIGGFAAGRWQGPDRPAATRFRSGCFAVGWAMALYTGITLISLREKIHTGSSSQVLLVGLFVTGVYAAVAGIVAGFSSARLASMGSAGGGP